MSRRTLSLCTLVLLLPAELFAQPLTVRAVASPTTVLAGLPTTFLLTVTNNSADPQVLLDGVRLHVTHGDETFIAIFARNDEFSLPESTHCAAESCVTLGPGATQTIYFDFGATIDANPFFMDERLSLPGAYAVQFELHVDHQSAGAESILSQPATFTVAAPSGADATFWQHMQDGATRQTWSAVDWMNAGKRLASEAYANPTDTAYLPWLAGLVQGSTEQRTAAYDLALSKNVPAA